MPDYQTENYTLAADLARGCRQLDQFINFSIRPHIEQVAATSCDYEFYGGLFFRIIAWVRTLHKLTGTPDFPADFQAILAASRSIFETAVDLALLRRGGPEYTLAKLQAWEDSAKFKSAERICNYLGNAAQSEYPSIVEYCLRERTRITQLRADHLNGRHPPHGRWTGKDLADDSIAADACKSTHMFRDYYNITYPFACWNVHGSGIISIRGAAEEVFPLWCARGFTEILGLTLLAAQLVLELIGCANSETEQQFVEFAKSLKFSDGQQYLEMHR